MRGRLFAALLASTMLTPARADADPITAFAAGFLSTVGISVPLAGSFGAFIAGVNVGTAVFGTLVGRTLLSIGLSALAQSFAPRPSYAQPQPSAQMGNFAQPISYAEWVFGRTRKGGPIGFTAASGPRRFYVVILAAHECEGIVQHWLDEYTVGLDASMTNFMASNLLTSSLGPYTAPDAMYEKGRIEPFLGDSAQTANAGLVAQFTEITSAHDFEGLCGAVCWAHKVKPQDFSAVYPQGRQWDYLPVLDGNNQIYDPRDDSYKFTANAALCLAYWITEILGGEVDWDEVAEEADASDVTVTTAEAASIAKWEINGTLSDDASFDAQRAQMAGACDAFMYERTDGKVGFKVGRWIEPTVNLTTADFLSCEVREGQWGADAPTEVTVTYIEPDNAWREWQSGTWVEDATSRRVRDEPQLYMVRYHNQAARLAKRIAKARRPQYTLAGTIGLMGYELIGQRFFTMTHAGLGITQTFEVGTLRRVSSTMFEIEAVSVEEADFDFDAATEEPTRPTISDVDSSHLAEDITGVNIQAASNSRILVEWDAQNEAYWQQVRWQEDGETEWQEATISSGATEYIITGLVDGTDYDVQARNVFAPLGSGDGQWLPDPAETVTAVQDATPPTALAAFSTSIDGSDVEVIYTSANDARHAGTRIYRHTASDLGAATLVTTIYHGPNTGGLYVDSGLSADTYYFWGVPINTSGIEGTESGPETETIT
jgi:hypothetical protein